MIRPRKPIEFTEAELVIYGELGEFLDKYHRLLLHSREHEQLAIEIAEALKRLHNLED